MQTFLLSDTGTATGIARRIKEDDHEVAMFVGHDRQGIAGEGIVPRVRAWREAAKQADIVIVDGNIPGEGQEWLNKNASMVFGGNTDGVAIEPPTPGAPIYDIVTFWNGRSWAMPLFGMITAEHLLAGNLGPQLAPMGMVMWPMKEVPTCAQEAMKATEPKLKSLPYRGMFKFQVCFHDGKWNLVSIQAYTDHIALMGVLELARDRPLDFLLEVAAGVKTQIDLRDDLVAAARLSRPPWPYQHTNEAGNLLKPFKIDSGAYKHIWEADLAQYHEEPFEDQFACGRSGFIGFATARGTRYSRKRDIIREPMRRLARVISGVHAEQLQYRNDLAVELHQQLITIEELCQVQ